MSADTALTLATLRTVNRSVANGLGDAPFWFVFHSWGKWHLCLSDFDDDTPPEIFGPGDTGEEAALRVAIARNKALCPAEPVAEEVDP